MKKFYLFFFCHILIKTSIFSITTEEKLSVVEMTLEHASKTIDYIGVICTIFLGALTIFLAIAGYIQWSNKKEINLLKDETEKNLKEIKIENLKIKFQIKLNNINSASSMYEKIYCLKLLIKDKEFKEIDTDIINYYLGIYTNDDRILLEFYQNELKKNKENIGILLNLGNLYRKISIELSKNTFEQILNLDNSNVGAFIGIGNYYCIKGDYFKALEYYKSALQLERNAFVLTNIANVYLELASQLNNQLYIDQANELYKEACLLEPNNSYALAGMGNIYFLRKQYSLAKLFMKIAIQNGDNEERTFHILYLIYEAEVNSELAEYYLQEANKRRNLTA
ncbi:MAG: hypothetical protein RSB50_07995 [Cetobacterium sp.]